MFKTTITVFISSLIIFFIFLFDGIHIDNFSTSKVKFSQLYLKYDKKLIFSIEKLEIPKQSTSQTSFDPSIIGLADEFLAYFSLIEIKNLVYDNKSIYIKFQNNQFVLKEKDLDIKIDFEILVDKLVINSNILSKKYNLEVLSKTITSNDKLTTNLNNLALDSITYVKHQGFNIKVKTKIKDGNLYYKLDEYDIRSLDSFKKVIPLNFSFEKVIINQLEDKIALDTLVNFDLKTLNTKFTIINPVYKSSHINTIKTPKLVFDFRDEKLNIKVNNLHLEKQKLTFSGLISLKLEDIIASDNIRLSIDDLDFRFEQSLKPLKVKKVSLQYLNDNVSLTLENPTYNTLALDGSDIHISNITSNNPTILTLNLQSKAILQDKLLEILEFYKVKLPFYQISGTNLSRVRIKIPFNDDEVTVQANTALTNATIKFDDKQIFFSQITIDVMNDKVIDASLTLNSNINQNIIVNSSINTETKIASGSATIYTFNYSDIVNIYNETFTYQFDFSKPEKILNIPKYDLKYKTNNKFHNIQINNFNNLLKFIKDITLIKTNKKIKVSIDTNDNFETTKSNIRNLKVLLNETYFTQNPLSKSKINLANTQINLYDGLVKYKDLNLFYELAILDIEQSRMNLQLVDKNTKISSYIDFNKETISINSNKITHTYFNKFTANKYLKDGYLSLNSSGTFKEIKGKILFHKTTVKDLLFINNLVLFVNTTPAIINPLLAIPTLVRMAETNFDLQGYFIKSGFLEFAYNPNSSIFQILNSSTKSNLVDFKTKGYIDFSTDKINMTSDVIFMKDYAKIISKIPLIGKLATDKNNNFSTEVNIFGTLEKPEFSINPIVDTIENIDKKTINILNTQ